MPKRQGPEAVELINFWFGSRQYALPLHDLVLLLIVGAQGVKLDKAFMREVYHFFVVRVARLGLAHALGHTLAFLSALAINLCHQ